MKWIKRKNIIFCGLIVLFFPLPVFAQGKNFPDIDKYFSKKEKETFEYALEYQNAFFTKIFPDTIVGFSEIQISVTTDVKELGDILLQKKASGYYSSSDRKLVIFKTEKFKNTFLKTTFHELNHALLHRYSGFQFNLVPPWLVEGLAEYLAGMSYGSKKNIHKTNDYLIVRIKTLIELRDLDLVDCVNWEHSKFTKESFSQDGYGYAVGYCIVLFLMKKDEKFAYSLFRSLIEENMSTTEVFDKYYKGGFSQFVKDFITNYS
jgi:uncharacterized protein YjaZ